MPLEGEEEEEEEGQKEVGSLPIWRVPLTKLMGQGRFWPKTVLFSAERV